MDQNAVRGDRRANGELGGHFASPGFGLLHSEVKCYHTVANNSCFWEVQITAQGHCDLHDTLSSGSGGDESELSNAVCIKYRLEIIPHVSLPSLNADGIHLEDMLVVPAGLT